MAEAYVGEIRVFAFNYAPPGWLLCQGQTLSISQNQALFALLGTVYGGDGMSTFALPDLRGRVPLQWGQGPLAMLEYGQKGGTSATMAQASGTATITSLDQLPAHSHAASFTPAGGTAGPATVAIAVSKDAATSASPIENGYLAGLKVGGLGAAPSAYVGTATKGTITLGAGTATVSGGGTGGGSVAVGTTGAATPNPIPVSAQVQLPPLAPPFLAMNFAICVDGIFPPRP